MGNCKLSDRNGSPIEEGMFIKLLRPIDGVVPGPYQFRGYRKAIPYLSVVGIDFPLQSIDSRYVEKLEWQEWKRRDHYLDRFLKFYYKKKNLKSAIA